MSKPIKKLSDLTPDPHNARGHDDRNVDMISSSLSEVGAARSIVIDEDGRVLAGNATINAAAKAGIDEVKVVEADGKQIVAVRRAGLTEEEKRRLALFDNRTAELATWDVDVLKKLRDDDSKILQGLFEAEELHDLMGSLAPVQTAPDDSLDKLYELQQKWGTELGQVWKIANHRVMCGDSTSEADVGRLMDGERAELCLTDPPYNVGKEYHSSLDRRSGDAYELFSRQWFTLAQQQTLLCVFTPGLGHMADLAMWWQIATPTWMCIWTKGNSMARSPLGGFICYDPILVYGKPEGRRIAHDVYDYPVVIQADVAGGGKKLHPTPRLLDLWVTLMKDFSGGSVYDPFLGSGTTLVAAHQLGRICYGMEIDPSYVAVTLERLSEMGLQPELEE